MTHSFPTPPMALHRLALALYRSPSEFLLALQPRPPMPPGDEYQKFSDSDLFDLPSAPLRPLKSDPTDDLLIRYSDRSPNLRSLNVPSALEQTLSQVGLGLGAAGEWEISRYVEEPEFGPGPPVHTVFVRGRLISEESNTKDMGTWIDISGLSKLLSEVKPCSDRIGPLAVVGLLSESLSSRKWKVPSSLQFQEYPPGVTVVPMQSRTAKPFWTTNLVVVASNKDVNNNDYPGFFSYGDALLADPGCCSKSHSQLAEIVSALPRKLVVFVTHHHHDHIDGLSVVQRCNPDAILLAHEKTITRIGKDKWSVGHRPVCGGEKICIGGQQLEVIFAPGHTDGHIALLHVGTNSLIVGDHCVGQGSTLLDVNAGGSMKDYFESTYKFMEISPHVILPMHGRINVWPKQMLCGYLKSRRDRELSILKAIEDGSKTLFDIVSTVYANVDVKLWFHASSNVRIHVNHLDYQNKLPNDFSVDSFCSSYDAFFAEIDHAKANA